MGMLLDRPRQWRARAWFFQVHMWAGVLTAVYVIVSSLTGSALMFREEITELVAPSPRVDPGRGEAPVPPEAAVEALRGAMEGYWLWSLVMPERPGGPYGGALLGHGQYVLAQVHPATGEVYRTVTRRNSGWRWLSDLHNNLMSGRTGRVVNGIGGISVLVLCMTGLVIWWPGRTAWKRGFRIEWRARWPRLVWSLHGAVGIWMLALIAVISFTGLYHVWPRWFRSAAGRVAPLAQPQATLSFPEAEGAAPAGVSRLIASAEAALPGRRVHSVQFSRSAAAPIRVMLVAREDPVMMQSDVVLLHPVTARVVRVELHADHPAGEALLRWLGPVHAGHFAGMWSKIVWFAAGLLMAAIAGTGLVLWWNRVVRRRMAWKDRAAATS